MIGQRTPFSLSACRKTISWTSHVSRRGISKTRALHSFRNSRRNLRVQFAFSIYRDNSSSGRNLPRRTNIEVTRMSA